MPFHFDETLQSLSAAFAAQLYVPALSGWELSVHKRAVLPSEGGLMLLWITFASAVQEAHAKSTIAASESLFIERVTCITASQPWPASGPRVFSHGVVANCDQIVKISAVPQSLSECRSKDL